MIFRNSRNAQRKLVAIRGLQKNHAATAGFTLVELLVVILIIAVLATLAIYASRNVKQKAYQVKALNSIRQVSAFNTAYSTENNGDINVLLDTTDPRTAGGYITKNYWGRLAPYIFPDVSLANNGTTGTQLKQRLNSLFSTPDSKLMTDTIQQGSGVYADGSGLPVPFAFSTYIYKWNNYLKVASFSDPSQTLYMTFGFYRFNEADGATYAPMPLKGTPRSNNIDYLPNRTGIFTFLDGHVESLSVPIPKRRFTTTP